MHLCKQLALAFTTILWCSALSARADLVIGTWASSRSAFPFATSANFDEARSALAANFTVSYVELDKLTDAALSPIDLLLIDTAGVTTPLTGAEQAAMSDFVNSGGTLLAHVFGGFRLAIANSILSPFSMSAGTSNADHATRSYTVTALAHPFLDGPFGVVHMLQNRYETGIAGVAAAGGVELNNLTGFGPTLVLVPRGVHGSGQAMFFTNFHAFADPDAWGGGLFSAANDNDVLLLNVAAASTALVPEPASITLSVMGALALFGNGCRRKWCPRPNHAMQRTCDKIGRCG